MLVLACLNWEGAGKGGGSGRGGFAWVSHEAFVKPLLCICEVVLGAALWSRYILHVSSESFWK